MTNANSKTAETKREFDEILKMIEDEKVRFLAHMQASDKLFSESFKRIKKLEQQCSDIHVVTETESEQSDYEEDGSVASEDEESDIPESPKTEIGTAAFDYENFDKERFTQPVDDFSEDFTQIDAFDESEINEKKRKREPESDSLGKCKLAWKNIE